VSAKLFKHLTVDDGLPQMSVYALEKDATGYMWVGTGDGLSRYDGYHFVTLDYEANAARLPSHTVSALKMGKDNILWVGTSMGVARVNTQDLTVLPALNLRAEDVLQIVSHHDSMWIVQRSGISEFRGGTKTRFFSIDDLDVLAIAITENSMWIGTSQGLFVFDLTTGLIDKVSAINELVDFIFSHTSEELLLATASGLVKFNIHSQNIEYYSIGNFSDVNKPGHISFIAKHSNGHIWLGSWNEGLYELDENLQILNVYTYTKEDESSLSNNEPKSIYIDDDTIWIGNQGGGINLLWSRALLIKHIGKVPQSKALSHPLIRSIAETGDALLVGTSDGLNNITFSDHQHMNVEVATIIGDCTAENRAVSAITPKQDGKILVGTTGAGRCSLFEYDAKQNELHPLPYSEKFQYLGINQILQLTNGVTLLLTVDGIYQIGEKELQRLAEFAILNEQVVWSGMQDTQGRLWLGTHSQGIYLFSPSFELVAHFENAPQQTSSLSSNYVKSFLQVTDGSIWIGTAAGLNRFNEKSQSFSVLTTADGLSNNTIYGILEDELGYLWLSTNAGINRFNPVDKHIWQLDKADGLQSSEFNTGAYFKRKNGQLVFGGINGINILQANKLHPKENTNKIRIGQLSLSSEGNQVERFFYVDDLSDLQLNYQNTRTQLSLSSLAFINQKHVQYAYQLIGLSNKWFDLPIGENVISFSALASGSYRLMLKSRNSDGIWSAPQFALHMRVVPAPWFSPVAFIFYLLFFILVSFGLYNWRINILKNNQRKLEEQVFERTETINQQAQVLVLQNEVLQKTIAEKDNIFAHVTHEFKTPLTLVLNPLKSLSADASESQKTLLELVERNSQRLNYLVDQLVGFSEIAKNNAENHLQVIDLNKKLKFYLSDFSAIFNEKSIRVELSVDEHFYVALPLNILDLVLSNLISNAAKYCSEKGIISVSIAASSVEFCNLSITNTHKNLSDEQLKRMFERFYRVPMHQTQVPGTGLGLALVKDALSIFNCQILARNVDAGIEISLTLPRATGQSEYPQQTAKPLTNKLKQTSLPQHLEIKVQSKIDSGLPLLLIIEDDPDMRTLLHLQLASHFDLLVFSLPEEGIQAAIEQIPDIILLDYMLPQLNGDEVTSILRSKVLTCHIPILILTAKANKQTKLSTMRALVDDIMAKPFDTEELLVRLHSLLEIRQLLSKKQQNSFEIIKASANQLPDVDQAFRLALNDILQQHYSDADFDIVKLANLLNVSERQLQRKCKSCLDLSPKSYIRDFRLVRAKEKLQTGEQITRVGYDCGFSSSAYFTQCYKAYFGHSPSEFKKDLQA